MKIDRRSFLSFTIGGAAGTVLSPLPWKLMDDVSIWSQRWPWVPIPQKGEAHYVNSVCTLCPGGCGISVRMIDERVVKIEGMPDHPVNDGGICTLGLSAMQLLYGPTRIKSPLKKINGNWRRISWENALSEVAAKLGELRSNDSAHKVACISGSDRGIMPELLNRFLTVYGSPNFVRMPSIQDTYEMTLYLTQGSRAMAGFDLENSDFVLSFGSGVVEGWGSPVYMLRSKAAMRKSGGRMDQVEPRLSKTAAKSDRWVPITPGTEGALALGIAHIIIAERLYKDNFIEGRTSGIGRLAKLVAENYSPDAVSQMTGVDSKIIVTLAKQFAAAKKPLAICGRGEGSVPGSLQDFLAVHYLNALAGNINQPGGIWAVPEPDYIDWPDVEMDEIAANSIQQARIDNAGGDMYPYTRYIAQHLPQAINTASDSPVEILFVANANPVYSLPDTQAVQNAFEKIPYVVSFSSYMDETAAMADLILPSHVSLERLEDVPVAIGFPKPIIGLAKPVVEPQFNTKYIGDVIIELSKAMGDTVANAFPWDNYEACVEETLGDKWDTLIEETYWVNDAFSGEPFENGKFEFANSELAGLPEFRLIGAEGDEATFPLLLVPYDSMRLATGYIGSPPFLVKVLEDSILKGDMVFVEVNPETAAKLGLSDGKAATLSTPRGSAKVGVRLTNGIMPGVVALPRGLGHTAYDKFLVRKGVNVNQLIGSVDDSASGLDAVWGIRAKLA